MSISANLDKVRNSILDSYNAGNKLTKAKLDNLLSLIDNTKSLVIDKLESLANNNVTTERALPSQIIERTSNESKIIFNVGKDKQANDVMKNTEKSFAEAVASCKIDAYMGNSYYNKNSGNVIVRVSTNDDVSCLVDSIKSNNPTYKNINSTHKMMPKMLISSIPFDCSVDKEKLKNEILGKNEFLQTDKDFDVLFIFKSKENKINAVCKLSPNSRERMSNQSNMLKVGFKLCKMYDHLRLNQCSKCCRYGHTAKHCQSDSVKCTFCSGDHSFKACNKISSDNHKCFNCTIAQKADVAHHSFSKNCPIYKKEFRRLISKVDYSCSPPSFETFHNKKSE